VKKTNAARILDQHKIAYQLLEYPVDETDLSAPTVAAKVGMPVQTVYKTLALHGDRTGVIIVVIPGDADVDLKALATLSGNKKCQMLPLKEVQNTTGYIRGGVSPLGLKKDFPVFIHNEITNHPKICVSAGMRGLQLQMAPEDLIAVTRAKVGSITNAGL
jgi:Cys-tRNA(Pro)/Cys-tRNA(Cys) deacylase